MDPVAALREIGYWLERARADTHRIKAYRRAAETLTELSGEQRAAHERAGDWGTLAGIGPKTATIIGQSLAGDVPPYLAELREAGAVPLATGGEQVLAARRGELHMHSTWSDGGSSLEEMAVTAAGLGLEYAAITDHSPRLKVARGLSAARLREQVAYVDDLNAALGDSFRLLRGIEVDILDDGALDQAADLLAELEVVVASVHSKLRMDSESMTHRMVGAIANPRVNVLGHCTGRLVEGERGTRPQSVFDASVVFEACRQFEVAVEINARPERCDPPDDLLELAIDTGCLFALNTDAHAPGQLDFAQYGATRAQRLGLDPDRIINTWPVQELLDWCRVS
ncbi:PHP domain-containing protein [Granulicoccus phenolivorans]|uniref:PHP domain-containing protein n=1 Tax=Granulicoccus phenolivorans TaxID=266854 RepID=UPI000413F89A|nr:PHP domain-containing protein [Granulicoccus phenolivorans]